MKNRQKDLNVFNEKFNEHIFYSCKCMYKSDDKYKSGSLFLTPDNFIFISYSKKDSLIFNVPINQINSFRVEKTFIKNNLKLIYGDNITSIIEFNNETNLSCSILFIKVYKYNENKTQIKNIKSNPEKELDELYIQEKELLNQTEMMPSGINDEQMKNIEENNKTNEFFIVGAMKDKELNKNFELSVNELINRVKRVEYGNDTNSELKNVLEIYDKIYKYNPLQSSDIKLIPEPENEYDKNAIAVYLKNRKVGYVKRNETEDAAKYMKQNLKPLAKISGGPFKTLDYFDEIVEKAGPYKLIVTFNSSR